jgi:hypothetical protein
MTSCAALISVTPPFEVLATKSKPSSSEVRPRLNRTGVEWRKQFELRNISEFDIETGSVSFCQGRATGLKGQGASEAQERSTIRERSTSVRLPGAFHTINPYRAAPINKYTLNIRASGSWQREVLHTPASTYYAAQLQANVLLRRKQAHPVLGSDASRCSPIPECFSTTPWESAS